MSWPKTSKDVKEKELRKLYRDFIDTWRLDKEHGTWEKIEPYQNGWIRDFDLRDDIKNRDDAVEIRQVLKRINNTRFCRNEDFMEYDWKTKKDKPIHQVIGNLRPDQYEELSEKHKSYFVKMQLIETTMFPFKHRVTVTRYVFRNDFWFVFKIEPNMIHYHWHPDPEWETHCTEIQHRIDRGNLWPKINKMLGVSTHYRQKGWKVDKWLKNERGEIMTIEGYEEE